MVTQDIKNLAKTIHTQKKSVGSFFSQASTAQEFMTTLSQKSYYENYSLLYYTTIFFAFVSQLATAISSYTFFADLLAIKLSQSPQGLQALAGMTVALLLLIEVLKYVSFNKGLEGVFALPQRINYALLVFAMLLCAASMYASITGGGSFGIDTQHITSTETKFDSEIATLRTEIGEIHKRNTWKGNVWLPKKEKALLYQKENQLAQAKTEKEKALNTVIQDNEIAATQYQFGFAFFDTLFILCTLYVWYFRKQVAIEAMVEQTSVNSYQTSVISHQPVNSNPHSNPRISGHQAPIKDAKNMIQKNREGFRKLKNLRIKSSLQNSHSDTHSEGSVNKTEVIDDFAKTKPKLNLDGNRICKQCNNPFIYQNFKRNYYCSKECCDIASAERRKKKRELKKLAQEEKAEPTNVIKPVDLFS